MPSEVFNRDSQLLGVGGMMNMVRSSFVSRGSKRNNHKSHKSSK